mgnify:CR=1 FL=1
MEIEITAKTVFTIPIFGGIPVTQTVVSMWIVMGILIAAAIIIRLTVKWEIVPHGLQNAVETLWEIIYNFIKENLGSKAGPFVPYFTTIALFLGVANMLGLLGFRPPTSDITLTATLAIMSMVIVIIGAIKYKGFKGWLHSFTEPIGVMLPFNIMDYFIRPLSLAARLFGNILASMVIMDLVFSFVPIGLPPILSLYFDLFDGIIQTVIFLFLSMIYLSEAIE